MIKFWYFIIYIDKIIPYLTFLKYLKMVPLQTHMFRDVTVEMYNSFKLFGDNHKSY